jgi:hypothetical protein
MGLDKFIKKALNRAWTQFKNESAAIDVELFDESVFRFLFLRALKQIDNTVDCRTEWRGRVDLYVEHREQNAAVEFKFYVYRFHYDRKGKPGHRKGGPGTKNAGEFKKCLKKLAKLKSSQSDEIDEIDKKYLIAVYQKDKLRDGNRCYEEYYAKISGSKIVPRGCKVKREYALKSFLARAKSFGVERPKTLCCKLIEVA